MSSSIVHLNSLSDLVHDNSWRICEQVVVVEEIRKVGKTKNQVFNFYIGCRDDETIMIVETWCDLAIICNRIVHINDEFFIGKAELLPDTFRHKHRVATSDYRIRLQFGSELSRTKDKTDRLSNLAYLEKIQQSREITKEDNLDCERYYVLARIKETHKENIFYKTCSGDNCPRRKSFCWGNSQKCQSCDDILDEFVWNFRVILTLYSDNDQVKVTIFGDQAEKLFGCSGNDGHKMKSNDLSALNHLLKKTEDKRCIFLLQSHSHNGKIEFSVSERFEE